jgi:hypothetical protein
MYNKSMWGSSKRLNIQVQHTIIFTIDIVNLKSPPKDSHFLLNIWHQLLRANKVHTHGEENIRNDKNVDFIVDPHMPKALGSGLGLFQSPLVTIECMIWHWVKSNNPDLLVTELFFGCHPTVCKHHKLKVVEC